MSQLLAVQERWAAAWPPALACWSRYTKLGLPRWCLDPQEERRQGLSGSFAMIRLQDQAVVISLEQVRERRLEPYALQVLAHEIGHHVYCPASLLDQGRMLARMRPALPTVEGQAPVVANLYADLLINDRLQRSAGLDMAAVFRALVGGPEDPVWTLYMRIYEILWSLQSGSLAQAVPADRMEGDARLGARLLRSYARDWLDGAGRFAALVLPYLLDSTGKPGAGNALRGWLDAVGPAGAEAPMGLAQIEAGEIEGAVHPALDPRISGIEATAGAGQGELGLDTAAGAEQRGPGREAAADRTGPPRQARGDVGQGVGQYREPFEYGALLRSLGLALDDHEAAVRYYRERALPHLVRFPERVVPRAADPLPEGFESWDLGAPLEDLDWLGSVLASPRLIPGVTSVQRSWGTTEGELPERRPVDLDLYVDCSGSMPDPQRQTSYLTLAGAVVALSALRAGSRVQATLWSGAGQFETTGGFVADAQRVLRVVTGYLGGGTAFPISVLRDTYAPRGPAARPVHILVVSDEGVTTLFDRDERGASGRDVARSALEKAGGGGTLVLNLPERWRERWPDLVRAENEGWQIHAVRDWEALMAFARAFSRANYEPRKKT